MIKLSFTPENFEGVFCWLTQNVDSNSAHGRNPTYTSFIWKTDTYHSTLRLWSIKHFKDVGILHISCFDPCNELIISELSNVP